MPLGFLGSEYTRRCYMGSTFLVHTMERENIYVLHPGQVFGLNREPSVWNFLEEDGVHLSEASERCVKRIILNRMKSFLHELKP